MIRVIATDIDHTLLDERGLLPPTNSEALLAAAAQGVRIVLATARRYAATVEVMRRLNLPTALICHNGARIWTEDGVELRHLTIDLAVAQRVAEIGDRYNLPLIFTIDEINYYNPLAQPARTPTMHLDSRIVASLRQAITRPPTRIVAQGQHATTMLMDIIGDEQQTHLFQYSHADGEAYSAIAAHPLATKEAALALLLQRWNLAPANVLALGDADADVGMLRWAGVGVAVRGGMPQALAAADWIAPSARFGGVAVAIHRYVLNQ